MLNKKEESIQWIFLAEYITHKAPFLLYYEKPDIAGGLLFNLFKASGTFSVRLYVRPIEGGVVAEGAFLASCIRGYAVFYLHTRGGKSLGGYVLPHRCVGRLLEYPLYL